MYISAYNILDRISIPKNISICDFLCFLGILHFSIWFASYSYKYPEFLVRIKRDNKLDQNLRIFCPALCKRKMTHVVINSFCNPLRTNLINRFLLTFRFFGIFFFSTFESVWTFLSELFVKLPKFEKWKIIFIDFI